MIGVRLVQASKTRHIYVTDMLRVAQVHARPASRAPLHTIVEEQMQRSGSVTWTANGFEEP